ncbi:MAG: chorismate-binding protein [Pseudomonadota bacterium]
MWLILDMSRLPFILPLEGVSFERAASALASDRGFVAVDARSSGGALARCSIVASEPSRAFSFTGAFVTVDGHTAIDSPGEALSRFIEPVLNLANDPYLPFSGGCIGYIGFEGARALGGFEPARGFSRYPQCSFGIYHTAAIFDHIEGTSFIVSCNPDPKAASRDAHILLDRVEAAPLPPQTEAAPPHLPSEMRAAPAGREFRKQLESAFSWLRSEKLTRLHVARRVSLPSSNRTPVGELLLSGPGGSVRAMFTNEDAHAILLSRETILQLKGNVRPCKIVDMLADALPSATMAGEPVDRAIAFIGENESEHRAFYGGAFGSIAPGRTKFMMVNLATTFSDGAIGFTVGADMTADGHPVELASLGWNVPQTPL